MNKRRGKEKRGEAREGRKKKEGRKIPREGIRKGRREGAWKESYQTRKGSEEKRDWRRRKEGRRGSWNRGIISG